MRHTSPHDVWGNSEGRIYDYSHTKRSVFIPGGLWKQVCKWSNVSTMDFVWGPVFDVVGALMKTRHASRRTKHASEVQIWPLCRTGISRCIYSLTPNLTGNQMTGSAFVAPRAQNQNASVLSFLRMYIQIEWRHRWLYRITPSVVHQGFTKLPENPDVSRYLFG